MIGSAPDAHRHLLGQLGRYNFYFLLLAYVNVFALLGVANFRCNEVFVLHAIAAFIVFHCSFLASGLMIYICRALHSQFSIESPPVTMTAGLICQCLSLVGCIVFSTVAVFQFGHDNFFDEYKRLHWTVDQPGYWWHVLGTGISDYIVSKLVIVNLFSIVQASSGHFSTVVPFSFSVSSEECATLPIGSKWTCSSVIVHSCIF